MKKNNIYRIYGSMVFYEYEEYKDAYEIHTTLLCVTDECIAKSITRTLNNMISRNIIKDIDFDKFCYEEMVVFDTPENDTELLKTIIDSLK